MNTILRVFALYDSGVKSYMTPFFQDHKVTAIRLFQTRLADRDPHNFVAKYPDQYFLYELGLFDLQSASYVPHEHPVALGSGVEHMESNMSQMSAA